MVALLPPAQLVVPAGTREHSLALFSELWEAGCHRGSQELEVSPGVGEGQRMSAPSLLSTRPCQATGAPTHSTRCEWRSFRVEGWAGREACCEVEYRVTRRGSLRGKAAPLCSGERLCPRRYTPPTWSPSPGPRVPLGFPTPLPSCRPCTAQSQGAIQAELCSGPGPPSHLFH